MPFAARHLLSFILTAGAPLTVHAQDAIVTDTPQHEVVGNDIVVTAQRREQRLQDVPVSVSAIGGDTLQKMGASDIRDVISQTPGVRYQAPTGSGGFPVFSIRGVTLLDFSYLNESAVAIYADDVYLGNPAFATQQLFDIDRVEVLRGPQGTLYGRNATGGLVQFVSRRPTSEMSGNALVQYGSFEDVTLEGAISGPVSDTVRMRFAGRYNSNDGWQTNVVNGGKFGATDYAIGARATIEADLSDTALLTVSGHYSTVSGTQDGRAFFGQRNPANLGQTCSTADVLASSCANSLGFRDPNPDPRRIYSEVRETPYGMRSAGGYAKLDMELGDWASLTSITGYEWGKKDETFDSDAAAIASPQLLVNYHIDHKQFSQELKLSGDVGALNWLMGGIYYHDKRFFTATLVVPAQGNYANQKIQSLGAFSQLTYAITDTLNLTGGLRYTSDEKTLEDLAFVTNAVPGQAAGTPVFAISGKIKEQKLTWRLGADWKVAPDAMLYATASTGFKSGGWNTGLVFTLAGVGPVAPETITSFEFGAKTQFFDRKVTANIAAYHSNYRGIQAVATVTCATCPTATSQFINIGTAKIWGVEAEVNIRPVDGLTIGLGGSWNKNRLSAGPGVALGGVPLDGKVLANTPKWNFVGNFEWLPLPNAEGGSPIVGASISYESRKFFRPDNLPVAIQPGYALVDARVGWAFTPRIRLEAYAKNLFDKEYFVSRTNINDIAPATWGRPRQLGVRATAGF